MLYTFYRYTLSEGKYNVLSLCYAHNAKHKQHCAAALGQKERRINQNVKYIL